MRENKLHLKWFMTIFILSFLVNEGGGGATASWSPNCQIVSCEHIDLGQNAINSLPKRIVTHGPLQCFL